MTFLNLITLAGGLSSLAAPYAPPQQESKKLSFRPPATPLVTHDPYFSVWSFSDKLTDDWSRHWTGSTNAMTMMVRIDETAYRLAGISTTKVPALPQTNLQITPTRSIYTFEGAGVRVALDFLSPLLPHNLELVSRPVTYVTYKVEAIDGKTHKVQLYQDVTGEWVTNRPNEEVAWSRYKVEGMDVLRMGTQEQPILKKAGDDLRIDWGYLYVAAKGAESSVIASDLSARNGFALNGKLPTSDDLRMPRQANDNWPVLAFSFNLGEVGTTARSQTVMLAYDDVFALEYFHRPVRAYWKRNGMEADELLKTAATEHSKIDADCLAFDKELTADMLRVGGEKYVPLASLAYRQAFAAHKLAVDADGTLLYMSKENFSNGCIDTVDLIYPSSPIFLLLNPKLLKAELTPILDYAGSGKWKFPFAPHDLGTYPKANGQVYGGGEQTEENQMPVEESGNMLVMLAALAHQEGNAEYSVKHWTTITKWANYLKEKGLDPENQLCTDDFAGHLAHNANLSMKAIMGLGGYAQICEMLGKKAEANEYRKAAQGMAKRWEPMAKEGDHYKLAFDAAGSWSQKYNLVWDKLLGINVFPAEVARKEVAHYLKMKQQYGLPLDNRKDYTKLDWCVWSATLAEKKEDFTALIDPIYKWMNETVSRVPLTDWYGTVDGKIVGFQARSVVGGVYIPFLKYPDLWQKWSHR